MKLVFAESIYIAFSAKYFFKTKEIFFPFIRFIFRLFY